MLVLQRTEDFAVVGPVKTRVRYDVSGVNVPGNLLVQSRIHQRRCTPGQQAVAARTVGQCQWPRAWVIAAVLIAAVSPSAVQERARGRAV